jgi:hypothetical protein
LPVPDGPTRTRFSARPSQSSVRKAHWASPGIADAFGSQASNVLPDGSRAAFRCSSRVDRSRPAASSARRTLSRSAWSQPSSRASGAWLRGLRGHDSTSGRQGEAGVRGRAPAGAPGPGSPSRGRLQAR